MLKYSVIIMQSCFEQINPTAIITEVFPFFLHQPIVLIETRDYDSGLSTVKEDHCRSRYGMHAVGKYWRLYRKTIEVTSVAMPTSYKVR